MKTLFVLIKRNIKLFFKDKGMFFTSLITPLILLVLYATFLAEVYRDSFAVAMPQGFSISEKLINGTVGGQLFASLLAVCCITVPFSSNMLMVQDKSTGTLSDFLITPVKPAVLSMSYYISTLVSSLAICYVAMGACLAYIAVVGWYMSVADVWLLVLDVLLLVLFGTGISAVINFFLSTQGQMSALSAIVSAGYGFICGAYMPISQFGEGLQRIIMFLPGTYATSLLREHAMDGAFRQMSSEGIPDEVIMGIRDSVDCNIYFFDNQVHIGVKYAVVVACMVAFAGAYVLMSYIKDKKRT